MASLSPEQVQQYLDCIGLPQQYRNVSPSKDLLTALHVYTISTFPYENLSLHYNPSHRVLLDPQHLFEKMVTANRGRGGFCMEVAILYNHVLRSLGFDAYTAAARTRRRIHGVPEGDYPGWCHVTNIVTLPEGKYHSDVAFGGDGAIRPLPLVADIVHNNLGTQQIRLVREWLPEQVHRGPDDDVGYTRNNGKVWIYQYRNKESLPWNSFYSFPELEFLPQDWGVVNHWVCTHPDSIQVTNVLVVKFLRGTTNDSSDGLVDICEKRILANDLVKQNSGGKTQTVQTLKTEKERVDSLRDFFGITLLEDEKLAINGELKLEG